MTPLASFLRPLALAAALALAARPAAAQVIWQGRSGGFDITWSADDVSARRVGDGRLVFSLKRQFEKEWGRAADVEDEPQVREVFQSVRVLSVVGSVISVEDAWYCDCGGVHPISGTGFVAYDLARSRPDSLHRVPITELVPEAPLLRALTADRVIRAALDSAGAGEVRSLAALVDTARWQGVDVETPGDENDCSYMMGEAFPSHFAFHHVESGQVAIRFSLSHGVELCRGKMIQVGVLVPVPPRLRSALTAADRRAAGFLMKDTRRIAGERVTRFEWTAER